MKLKGMNRESNMVYTLIQCSLLDDVSWISPIINMVKIRNILNDNFTYFYVKKADASRIYGLELEHMLSPYNLNFLVFLKWLKMRYPKNKNANVDGWTLSLLLLY